MPPQLLTVIDKEVLKTWTEAEWSQWLVEPKYDGARLIYHEGTFRSRTGKPLNNLDHIAAELAYLEDWTLDGEIVGADWSTTMSVARSSEGKKVGTDLHFRVFDCMSEFEWNVKFCSDPLERRRTRLFNLIDHTNYVHPVGFDSVPSYSVFEKLHAIHLKMGCDGTVLKKRNSLYEFKRTKTWLKVKPVETYDGKVVGIYEGKGKYKGMLGGLEVDFDGVITNVSGMDDQQRMEWWVFTHRKSWCDHPKYMIGKTIEVAARGKHKSGCLIEPRFIRIREDK